MTMPQGEVTRVLSDLAGPDRQRAFDRLITLVHSELRAIALTHLRHERPDHTLQASALVNEAYLRLLGGNYPPWSDRLHFFRAAAEAMRRILIEHARSRLRAKRGGNRERVPLSAVSLASEQDPVELLALNEALQRLKEKDPRTADVAELRFFVGLSVEETATALEISERTVKREWALARAWLFNALREPDQGHGEPV